MQENPVRLFGEAVADAARFHGKQVRKDGTPYIYHPIEVAKLLNEADYPIRYQIAAVLHDVLEDTKAKPEDLAKYGEDVVECVKLLSRNYCTGTEQDYIDAILRNPMATAIKNADRIMNLQDMAALYNTGFRERYMANTKQYFVGKFTPALDEVYRQLEQGANHAIVDINKFKTYQELELERLAISCMAEANNALERYGFQLMICTDYDFDNDDFAAYVESVQDDAMVFPIAININSFIANVPKDEWRTEMLLSMYHEAGHGILDYLRYEELSGFDEFFDKTEDEQTEEQIVEEFARYQCCFTYQSELQDVLDEFVDPEPEH